MDEHLAPEAGTKASPVQTPVDRDSCPPHISELVKNWVSVAAVGVAAIWALWTFVYKEFWQPKQVPVNISLNLDMQKVPAEPKSQGARDRRPPHPLAAIELSVKATNPSSRTVFLLPSIWIAHGYKVRRARARKDLAESTANSIMYNSIQPVEKYANVTDSETVAAGRLFADDELKPSETITRRIVFHLPQGPYDVVDVFTCVPSTSDIQHIGIVWRYKNDDLNWQITQNGSPVPSAPRTKPSKENYQLSYSRTAMSLWR